MVLWEITLATAYFLGLRRTYRLALRIQRRIVGPRHPEIRQFVHRRTRSIFDVVVRVVQSIQHKDMEAGRSIGNSVLRWLDPTKPSAQVGVHSGKHPISSICISKYAASRSQLLRTGRSIVRITDQVKRGRSFFSPWNIPMKTFPTIGMMMQPMKPAIGLNGQYRHASHYIPNSSATGHSRVVGGAEGVLRRDIAQWMLHA